MTRYSHPSLLHALLCMVAVIALQGCSSTPDSYRDARCYLQSTEHGDQTCELRLDDARVLVAPTLQGRVLTSAFSPNDKALGWINRDAINAGETNPTFNNYGGEDRFWLAPASGPLGLFYTTADAQNESQWRVPQTINTGAYTINRATDDAVWMTAPNLTLTNTAGTTFTFSLERSVRIIPRQQLWHCLRTPIPANVEYVGFQSENRLTNLGSDLTEKTGTVAIWSVGQFPANNNTIAIIPMQPKTDADTKGFTTPSTGQLVIDKEHRVMLYRLDSKKRGIVSINAAYATEYAASIDFDNNILTIVMRDQPQGKVKYVSSQKNATTEVTDDGEVIQVYNNHDIDDMIFYELETISPAALLKTGESIAHYHRTLHFHGSINVLNEISEKVLGVSLLHVRKQMDL